MGTLSAGNAPPTWPLLPLTRFSPWRRDLTRLWRSPAVPGAARPHLQATYRPVGVTAPAGSREAVEAVASGAAPLTPVLHEPPERVLWSSVLPSPDMRAQHRKPQQQQQQQQECRGAAAPAAAPPRDLFADPSLPPPLVVTVRAGEALYLPAKWWHQVGRLAVPCCGYTMLGSWSSSASFSSGAACTPSRWVCSCGCRCLAGARTPGGRGSCAAQNAAALHALLQVEQEPDASGRAIAVNYWCAPCAA